MQSEVAEFVETGTETETEVIGHYYKIGGCGCRSRFCEDCAVPLGLNLRRRLLKVLMTFSSVQMWTLTVDPKLFSSPYECYEYVRSRRCVAELVRELRKRGVLSSGRYFVVCEFQRNGMPHWHLILDSRHVPFDLVCEVWNRYRPKDAGPREGNRPGFGGVRFSKVDFESVEHAVNYVVKYIIKTPVDGWPAWVLEYEGQLRRYSASRGFWGDSDPAKRPIEPTPLDESEARFLRMVGEKIEELQTEEEKAASEGGVQKQIRALTIRQRIDRCGSSTVVMECTEHVLGDGEVVERKRFLCRVPFPVADVARMVGYPETDQRWRIVADEVAGHLWRLFRERPGPSFGEAGYRYASRPSPSVGDVGGAPPSLPRRERRGRYSEGQLQLALVGEGDCP